MLQIRKHPAESGRLQVTVDGFDLTDHVFADHLALVRVGEGEWQEWGVQMTLVADPANVDLPAEARPASAEALAKLWEARSTAAAQVAEFATRAVYRRRPWYRRLLAF